MISFLNCNGVFVSTQYGLRHKRCTIYPILDLITVSILLVRKVNAKGSVSDFEIAPLSKGGGSDKHLAVD